MKLFNQFNILPRYLTAFNYAGLNLNETPKKTWEMHSWVSKLLGERM